MTNNTSTVTPSTQILDAAKQAQALADAGNALKPFFSPEIQETVDGVDKIAKAMNATGEALRHFGFDEAEPEVTTSEVDLIPTDDLQIVDNMNPTFGDLVPDSLRPSTYVIEGGQALQENGWKGTGEAIENAGQVMRAFGFDEAEPDSSTGAGQTFRSFGFDEAEPETFSQITGQDFGAEVDANGDETVGVAVIPAVVAGAKVLAPIVAKGVAAGTIAYIWSTFGDEMEPDAADSLTGKNVQAGAFDELGDEQVGIGPALPVAVVAAGGTAKVIAAAKVVGSAVASGGVAWGVKKGWERIFGDEMEPDAAEGPEFRAAFSSNPETLAPIDLNASVITDASQQQDAPGADLVGAQMNQGTEPYQAQDDKYAVLA